MSKGTTLRNVRISDELWNQVKVVAITERTTISAIVREALEARYSRYLAEAPGQRELTEAIERVEAGFASERARYFELDD